MRYFLFPPTLYVTAWGANTGVFKTGFCLNPISSQNLAVDPNSFPPGFKNSSLEHIDQALMEDSRVDGRSPNQLRPLTCSRNVLTRPHGSARWCQGDTIVLAAVYGPKAGSKKNESPEKASIEVLWKPKSGQIGKAEREYEMILTRTLQSIFLSTIHPNTTTSVIIQVMHDDGALLPCAINAACAALVDAGIPLKSLAVAICCGITESGSIILDPTKQEEQEMPAFAYLVFPNSSLAVLPGTPPLIEGEPVEHGIITSVTHGAMSGGAFGGNRGLKPVPPEKGVFPLDHLHECDVVVSSSVFCITFLIFIIFLGRKRKHTFLASSHLTISQKDADNYQRSTWNAAWKGI
ncbi:exosome complex exonuclease RRP46 homolog isoform X2 [Amborella trichopoda]|uniref:exosome complex exonuclease RRP46 homolog isoform X2 n=1 Tax=Amborella trichopoda TaxID=13333 RepID=UPI0009C16E8E|nr:exosome complex exonuclease RRP46 homolog isoform X2 [Amborella trichopoda]|eukprot:XP_020528726.1 exosome complex exonuclease RRP46 homolog isoform X2 [Amborella trichopoda]